MNANDLQMIFPSGEKQAEANAFLARIANATEQMAAEEAGDAGVLDAMFAAALDGSNTTHVLHQWFPHAKKQQGENVDRYVLLSRFATMCAESVAGKVFTVRGYKGSVSSETSLTAQDDLADMGTAQLVTEASTPVADWTDEYPLCGWYVRVNALTKSDGSMNVLAIEGLDTGFDESGELGPVYAVCCGMYMKWWDDGEYEYKSFSLSAHPGFVPRPECVNMDGTFRNLIFSPCYAGSLSDAGGLTSGSGRKPYIYQSASTGLTKARITSAYEGLMTDCDSSFLLDMWQVRHLNKENSNIAEGCLNYNYQYKNAVAETGVKRVLITTAQAANLVVGSTVLVGDNESTSAPDRSAAAARNIASQVKIDSIDTVTVDGTEYAAVNLEVDEPFDTTTTTWLSTIAWNCGSTDALPGHKDGCRHNLTAGKGPLRVMGIEVLTGCYDLGLDPLYNVTAGSDANHFDYAIYTVKDATKQATSITANYVDTGLGFEDMPKGWNYPKEFIINLLGILFPSLLGGSTSGWYKSGFYGTASAGLRSPWRRCNLGDTAIGGLAAGAGGGAPSAASWDGSPRLGGSGKTRGEWTA